MKKLCCIFCEQLAAVKACSYFSWTLGQSAGMSVSCYNLYTGWRITTLLKHFDISTALDMYFSAFTRAHIWPCHLCVSVQCWRNMKLVMAHN